MVRPIEKQFKARKVQQIRKLIDAYEDIYLGGSAGDYYVFEIRKSLEAGLLLSAVILSSALLELFARNLYITKQAGAAGNKIIDVFKRVFDVMEEEVEDSTRPRWDFYKILDELAKEQFIAPSDALMMRQFYKEVRIPLHHGLTRRYLRQTLQFDENEDELELSYIGRRSQFEECIEDRAVGQLRTVLRFVRKYSYTKKA